MRAPDPFYERPEIEARSLFFWNALNDLETERSYGMSIGPIPRSKAREYAIEHGLTDDDEVDDFWSIIRKLDNEAARLRSPKSSDTPDAPITKKTMNARARKPPLQKNA